MKLLSRIALGILLSLVFSTSSHAGDEFVYKDSQEGVASHLCYGVYCQATICVSIRNASNGQPGTARFFYEGGLFGDLEDKGEHTEKHCITDWGIGILAMRIEIKAISDNLIATVSDVYDK
ncbi:hypothetical protein O9X98_06540 [Agrobacterium salinitolerans]|nr:hypothetical protein [Agrobacterium salinitolerans]